MIPAGFQARRWLSRQLGALGRGGAEQAVARFEDLDAFEQLRERLAKDCDLRLQIVDRRCGDLGDAGEGSH